MPTLDLLEFKLVLQVRDGLLVGERLLLYGAEVLHDGDEPLLPILFLLNLERLLLLPEGFQNGLAHLFSDDLRG